MNHDHRQQRGVARVVRKTQETRGFCLCRLAVCPEFVAEALGRMLCSPRNLHFRRDNGALSVFDSVC